MGICTYCTEEQATCIISVFIPGRDAQGIHNTVEVARLCNDCIQKLIDKEITIDMPEDMVHI